MEIQLLFCELISLKNISIRQSDIMKVLTEESEIVPCETIGKEKTTEIQELLKSHEDQNNDW